MPWIWKKKHSVSRNLKKSGGKFKIPEIQKLFNYFFWSSKLISFLTFSFKKGEKRIGKVFLTQMCGLSVGWGCWIFAAKALGKFISYPLHRWGRFSCCRRGWGLILLLLLWLISRFPAMISGLNGCFQSMRSQPFFR